MRADEHHQQQLEQQQYERDLELSLGHGDSGHCDGCGCHSLRVTTWTPEGFRIRFGDHRANQLLKQPRPSYICTDAVLEDCGSVSLCHDCQYIPDEWSDE